VAELVLKDGGQARAGDHRLVELFREACLAPFEVLVEIDEDGVEGDPVGARLIPMVHVRLEALARTVAVHPQPVIEAVETKRPHRGRQMRAQA
jgi:hypothetical protein